MQKGVLRHILYIIRLYYFERCHKVRLNQSLNHLGFNSTSYTYLKYGNAHFNILMSGSRLLATDYNTIIFVSKVANYPSNFILFSRII